MNNRLYAYGTEARGTHKPGHFGGNGGAAGDKDAKMKVEASSE